MTAQPTIRVEKINWRGTDAGFIVYEIAYADGTFSYMVQPFSRGGAKVDGFDKAWEWDGNRDAPTLSPSYVCEDRMTKARVHLFLRAGKIELCSDSTVRVAYPA